MKIGLIDVDRTGFPNLALMKISSYHKLIGDSVEFINYWDTYDRVYMSKVFTYSSEEPECIQSDDIIRGGTGYNLSSKLDALTEATFPDYSLYGVKYALGFLTRGCSRGCPFCIVKDKEGSSHVVGSLNMFWNGQKEIKLLDPNILEVQSRESLLLSLVDSKSYIDFTQGLDVRLIDNDILSLLKKMKLRRVHFAYDRIQDGGIIEKNLRSLSVVDGFTRSKITVYILVNYDTTISEDLHRVSFVKSCGFQPYTMIYNKHLLPKKSFYFQLQRYTNSPQICWTASLEDYLKSYKMYSDYHYEQLSENFGEDVFSLVRKVR